MIVGVVSDTHDRLPMIDAALEVFAGHGAEALIHPGDFVAPFAMRRLLKFDGPIHATFGNNDGEREGLAALMPDLSDGPKFVELDGRRILIHHFIDWCEAGDIEEADIIITGHTHVVAENREAGRLYLNPGECCGWVTGRCTVALLDTAGPSVEMIDLECP